MLKVIRAIQHLQKGNPNDTDCSIGKKTMVTRSQKLTETHRQKKEINILKSAPTKNEFYDQNIREAQGFTKRKPNKPEGEKVVAKVYFQ